MTHVFVVDDTTFKYHLEYLFAGTCAKQDAVFLKDEQYINPKKKENGLTPKQELTIAGMIADISRIRENDTILFYLQQSKFHEGMFFGVFRAIEKPFFDSNDNNFLADKMGVSLHFRVKIEPYEVYPYGITEHEALDEIGPTTHPSEMCWSLIYRKLKGKRGCIMITDYESKVLIDKIKLKNEIYHKINSPIQSNYFSFNSSENRIVITENKTQYTGEQSEIDISKRMFAKAKRRQAYEAHLQAYIIQNCDTEKLFSLLAPCSDLPLWIGNEVSCGVGMQSIDTMLIQEDEDNIYLRIVELKCIEPYDGIIDYQLPWYIKWVKMYLSPLYKHKTVHIFPTILACKINDQNKLTSYIQKCKSSTRWRAGHTFIYDIEYIGYTINDDEIVFEKIV